MNPSNQKIEIMARAVGRRKEAVAQVLLTPGNGEFIINNKPAQVRFYLLKRLSKS